MDFFERQGLAKRRTVLLVAAFLVAVALVIIAVDAVVWGVLRFLGQVPPDPRAWLATPQAWWLSGLVALAILGTSFFRTLQLAHGGGGRVALLMGGSILDPDTARGQDAVLIHVVEEMAIASGVTVPDVYVLERETSLNAFAAGTQPANAVIGVTRGLLDTLDRDALQGVIAHEFSHILNGDMRLNIRLLALLAGITAVGEVGAAPWRSLAVSRGLGRRNNRGAPVILLAGLALIVIGWLGVFAGRLIKAAVSRQRECLADAAAVQFTRNPDGLASALLAIHERGDTGSFLNASRAEEISHMGFGRTVGGFSRLTATHPSLEERLTALGPKYRLWYQQAERERRRRKRAGEHQEHDSERGAAAESGGIAAGFGDAGTIDPVLSAAALAALAGQTGGATVDHARALLRRLPESVLTALRSPSGAADCVHALLLHGPEARERDLATVPPEARDRVCTLRAALEASCPGDDGNALDPAIRLPVIELALRSLRRLTGEDKNTFLDTVDALIRVNGRLSIFEYAARTLLRHQVLGHAPRGPGSRRIADHRADAALVMSLLAQAGHRHPDARRTAYAHAMAPLYGQPVDEPLPASACTLAAFSDAMERLDHLQPMGRRALLTACGDCIASDGVVRPAEAELLRIVAAILDTPIPPIAPHANGSGLGPGGQMRYPASQIERE